jgi:hypothetical protein
MSWVFYKGRQLKTQLASQTLERPRFGVSEHYTKGIGYIVKTRGLETLCEGWDLLAYLTTPHNLEVTPPP